MNTLSIHPRQRYFENGETSCGEENGWSPLRSTSESREEGRCLNEGVGEGGVERLPNDVEVLLLLQRHHRSNVLFRRVLAEVLVRRLRLVRRLAFRVKRRGFVGGVTGTLAACSRTDSGVKGGVEVALEEFLERPSLLG
jgi:hypothetical protein